MFEFKALYCPGCGAQILDSLKDGDEYACPGCLKVYHVLVDEQSRNVGFISSDAIALVDPLWLPKGSIRAITTILLSVLCWIMIIIDHTVPGYLLGLLLTVTGYYFAFRKKDGTQDRFYDVTTPHQSPLSLPSGSIRNFLIIGFIISAAVLLARGRLMEPHYVEFFMILAGLIAGHLLSKCLPCVNHAKVLNFFNHVKGLAVLLAVVALILLLLTGNHEHMWPAAIALSCVISFYFGSRS
jgi:hypothetical protein